MSEKEKELMRKEWEVLTERITDKGVITPADVKKVM